MFPLKSLVPREHFPFITVALILINVGLYFYSLELRDAFLFLTYGVVPAKLGMPSEIVPLVEKVYPFFTYMVLHGSLLHLLSNIYFLYVFGVNVEDYIGKSKFLVAYIAFGVLSGVAQVIATPTLDIPIIGASGAIAGIIGIYAALFPLAKMRVLFIIIIFIFVRNIHAMFFILLWIGLQVANSMFDMGSNVAWWAHIGGFACGIVAGIIFRFTKE